MRMPSTLGNTPSRVREHLERWRSKAKSFFRNPEQRASRLSLIKRVQLKRFLNKQARKIYRTYDTGEAAVYFIRQGKKRYIFRDAGESKEQAMIRFFAHVVLHETFPENNIHPIAFETEAHHNLKGKRYGLVSFPVRGRKKTYKRYQWWDYLHRSMIMIPPPVKPEIVRAHEEFVANNAPALAEQIKQTTGVGVSVNPSNVIDSNGRPVFVEYTRINVPTLLKFFKTHPDVRERVFKQLFPNGITAWNRFAWEKWVHEHLEFKP